MARGQTEIDLLTKIEVLDDFFVQNKQANEITDKFSISRATVYRLTREARQRGCIDVKVDISRWFDIDRDSKTEAILEERFPQLNATVIDLPRELSNPREYDPEIDHILHRVLGRAAARYVSKVIRPRDNIGVSGGWALAAMAEDSENGSSIRHFNGIKPYSLTGRVMYYSKEYGFYPDANSVAMDMRDHLKDSNSISDAGILFPTAFYLGDKMLIEGSESGKDRFEALFGWTEPRLNVAVFGIENVYPGFDHPIFATSSVLPQELRSNGVWDRFNVSLGSVTSHVLETPDLQYYYPLVGYLNRIEVVYPPGINDTHPFKSSLDQLALSCEELNSYAVGISLDAVQKAQVKLAIAGGLHKAFQIFHAINSGIADHLVTDSTTARKLVSLQHAYS